MDKTPDNTDLEFLISQYLDGQLEGRELADFERRLAEDPAVADELRRYQALDGALTAMAGTGLEKVDFQGQRASIMSALERKALLTAPRRRVFILRPAFWGAVAAAASIVLAVSVGMKVWPAGTGPVTDNRVASPMISSLMEPESPASSGQEVVRMALKAGKELAPDAAQAQGNLPVGTVIVSCSPPAEEPQEQTEATDSPLMLFEL